MSKFIKAADIKALTKNLSQMEQKVCGIIRQAEQSKNRTKIITVGDSITHGSYPALLQMMLNARKEATYNF